MEHNLLVTFCSKTIFDELQNVVKIWVVDTKTDLPLVPMATSVFNMTHFESKVWFNLAMPSDTIKMLQNELFRPMDPRPLLGVISQKRLIIQIHFRAFLVLGISWMYNLCQT